jgi:SAM-dependent methyltransferase
MKEIIARLHGNYVHTRRAQVLADLFSTFLPVRAMVLDVGCGDGLIMSLIQNHRRDLTLKGVDVQARELSHLPVAVFDGERLPYSDKSFDVVTFIDVLHHTQNPAVLLGEARRVASGLIIIKDHLCESAADHWLLRFMDFIGNKPHCVPIPGNYLSRFQWKTLFEQLNLEVLSWEGNLSLYPKPADWVFGRNLHFVAALKVAHG